jgi:ABC-type antimicrobial peptide transport system permease subunit
MSIGLLFIAMISFLWTYDDFQVNGESIYRVTSTIDQAMEVEEVASAPSILAEQISAHVPGIQEISRIDRRLEGSAMVGNREVPVSGFFVDAAFLRMFSFPLLKGNAGTALEKPNSILVTERAAKKLFGDQDPFGKYITIEPWGECEVTGKMKDAPKNSHIQFEILGSYATLLRAEAPINPWRDFNGSYIYFQALNNTTPEELTKYLASVSKDVSNPEYTLSFTVQPMSDIVLGTALNNEIGQTWDYTSMSIFLLLTLLILVPACFNYANISISRALKRMKEIGLRKVMGGEAKQIFVQFILETVIITVTALGIAFYFFMLIRQEFLNLLVGGAESLSLEPDLRTLLYFFAFAVLVGVAAGAVPALYFARLNPIQALKSTPTGRTRSGFGIRKVLLVTQFALSLGFIMSVVITFSQYRQSLTYDFGFHKENILDVALQGVDPARVKNEMSRLASVERVSMSSQVVGAQGIPSLWVRGNRPTDSAEVFTMAVDEDYIATFRMELVAGKNFQETDKSKQAIVNETLVKQFGLGRPFDALGTPLTLPDGQQLIIVGVVKDFHYVSLRQPIQSFFFRYDPTQFQVANVTLRSNDIFTALTAMESAWKTIEGEKKFTAKFFDDELEEAYAFHFSIIKICGFLGLLAISIASLGLLGMVVFTVENRVKEIGIRKVMGASTATITYTLSWDFLRLMLIAAPIAIPLTYLFFEKVYLRNQFYKIPIGAGDIILSLALLLAIGLSTILSQTMKAARANPADSLRTE